MSAPRPADVLSAMLDRLPETEHTNLVIGEDATEVPARLALDDRWLREQLRLRGLIWGIDDPFILGTLWWYSASNWLALPTLASRFLADRPLSARLDDVLLFHRPDSRITGARGTALHVGSADAVPVELAESLGAVMSALAPLTGKGERRLWSIAVDSIAGRLLWAGRATGRVAEAIDLAREVVGLLPGRQPVPRFAEVERDRDRGRETFVRRGSCCLLYLVPDQGKCGNCPRQRPAERTARLRARGA